MEFGRFNGEEDSYQGEGPNHHFQPQYQSQGVCWCKGEVVHHLRTLIGEEVEKALKKVLVPYLPSLQSPVDPNSSSLPHSAESSASRRLRLQFKSNIPNNTFFTMTKLEDQCALFEVELLDEFGRRVDDDDLESAVKIKFDVLDGDYNVEGVNWAQKDYSGSIVKPRKYKGELLKGECKMALRRGVTNVGHLCITDNSSHTRSGMFKLGAKAECLSSGVVIDAAVSEAFKVKERRLKSDRKLENPSAESALCCLVGIGKKGPVYDRARKAGVFTVQDFLQRLNTNAKELKNILDVSETSWNAIVRNAKACKLPQVPIEGSSHHDDGNSYSQISYQEPICSSNDVQTEQELEQLQPARIPDPSPPLYLDAGASWHSLNADEGPMHGCFNHEYGLPCDWGWGQLIQDLLDNSPQREERGIVSQGSAQNPITSKLLAACYVTKAAALFMVSVQQESSTPQKRQRLQ